MPELKLIKISFLSALLVVKQIKYLLIAVSVFFVSSALIMWALNFEFVRYVIYDVPLNFVEKVDFFLNIYWSLLGSYPGVHGLAIILFSTLFGVNIALLVFVYKNNLKNSHKLKTSFGGLGFAVVSGGCVACGTSVIVPLLATVGATSSFYVRSIATSFNLLGSILIIYSIYKLGLVVGKYHILESK